MKNLTDEQLAQKCDELNASLDEPDTLKGKLIVFALIFGLLSLGAGIINILQNGINLVNGIAVLFGAITSYYWRERDRKKKSNSALLSELLQEKSMRLRKPIDEILNS